MLCVVGGFPHKEGTRTRVALYDTHGPCHRGVTTHTPSLNPRMFVRGSLCIRSRCLCWGHTSSPLSSLCSPRVRHPILCSGHTSSGDGCYPCAHTAGRTQAPHLPPPPTPNTPVHTHSCFHTHTPSSPCLALTVRVCSLSRCCGWESWAIPHSTCSLSPLQHLHASKKPPHCLSVPLWRVWLRVSV